MGNKKGIASPRYDKKWKTADFLLLGSVLLIGIILGLFLIFMREDGESIEVRVAGAITTTISIKEDGRYSIEGVNEGHNMLVVQAGEVWMEEASCPDGLCMLMGKISQKGQAIVCLPNQVVVEIVGSNTVNDVDIVVH